MVGKFNIFDTVSTVYGPGFVSEVRDNDYVVKLGNWQLAQGQSPTCYLQEESIRKIPGAFPGTLVKTVYGVQRVDSIRGTDGAHICHPVNWFLANDTHATSYLQGDAVSLTFTEGVDHGDAVMTVYGQGYVESVREKDVVVKLDNWALAQGQSPTCYLQASACVKIPGLRKGQAAKTVWGMVRVLDILRDGKHVCQALHWNLADGNPPTFYLSPEAFGLLSIKPGALNGH